MFLKKLSKVFIEEFDVVDDREELKLFIVEILYDEQILDVDIVGR